MKVLFAASECAPIVKIGGLGDVVGSLPKALKKLGVDVGIIIPKYKVAGFKYPEFLPGTDIPVFYIENDTYFGGGSVYPGGDEEHERFAYFSRAVVDFLDTRTFEPEVIHCHDYHTALIPDILKDRRKKISTVLTIHDLSNDGTSSPSILDTALLSSSSLRVLDWDLADKNIGMILQGLVSADVINTVSPTYAREIMTKERGEGLEEILKAREARVFGILNGIDLEEYDPVTDKNLFVNFPCCLTNGPKLSAVSERKYLESLTKAKDQNKEALLKQLGLEYVSGRPLVSLISRLVERKGLSLVIDILEDLIKNEVSVVILGKGEPRIEETLAKFSQMYPKFISVQVRFDEALARQIYASSDIFLVPSLFEPCGLTQMIAMRYGAVPVVHQTGGLADTVEDGLNGFSFRSYGYNSFKESLFSAIGSYRSGSLKDLMAEGLRADLSWGKAASSYVKLYEKAINYKFGIVHGVGGEIRRDSLGGWTILSTIRRNRPDQTGSTKKNKIGNKIDKEKNTTYSLDKEMESCPFEEGHESMAPDEVFRIGDGLENQPGWRVRVVPNKYPIVPAHEVIVHSPFHNKELENFSKQETEDLIWAYLSRYRHYEDFGYVHIFCNRGREAAASIKHPHSQLIVLDEIAKATVEAVESAGIYYRTYGICPYCDLLRREIGGDRFIWENDSMVLLAPFSSDWPYEISIIPKTHRKSFGNINDREMRDFAECLRIAVIALSKEINELSYNYWIHSLPSILGLDKASLYYHWHLDLIPRVKVLGGVELGLKLMIDDRISPEDAASKLKSHILESDTKF